MSVLGGTGGGGRPQVGPRSHDGAEDHQAEREEDGRQHAAPSGQQHLAVGDGDDGQVLEDGEDGHRQELQGLAARVDLGHEEDGDGEPWTQGQSS